MFSLQGHKLAPAGEGGVLLTRDAALFERATLLGDVARIRELPTPARRFAATGFGMKTRMSPFNAAVGRVQLRHLDERNARRTDNVEHLSAKLERLGFDCFRPPPHVRRVYFEFLVRADPARVPVPLPALVERLRSVGADVSLPRYPLVHQQPFFTEGAWAEIARPTDPPTYRAEALPRTAALNGQLLRLPSFPSATRPLLDQYAAAFEWCLADAA